MLCADLCVVTIFWFAIISESGGSLLRHPEGVFLDVEAFALSLAPILNHKEHETDAYGKAIFGGRQLEHVWQLNSRRRLFDKGILHACFARCLWHKDDGVDLPELAFEILVKLGILLPLPRRHQRGAPCDYATECATEWGDGSGNCGVDYLVVMRLPKKLPPEIKTRLVDLGKLRKEWGVVVKWEFDRGSAPHGLVERLVASCHVIGDVIPETCWRGGACFVAHENSKTAAGGRFALSIDFSETTSNRRTAGTLTVRAFGNRTGCAVRGALRFVISRTWRLFEEFPGLGWEAWIENPDREDGQLLYYLAGVKDIKVGFHWLIALCHVSAGYSRPFGQLRLLVFDFTLDHSQLPLCTGTVADGSDHTAAGGSARGMLVSSSKTLGQGAWHGSNSG